MPASNVAGRPPGILLWLHASGEVDVKAIIAAWQPICDRDGMILVVPTAADMGHWERTEIEYLRRLLEQASSVNTSPIRTAMSSCTARGAVGRWLGCWPCRAANLVRGVATTAAPLPRQVRVPENEPAQRLAIFAGLAGNEGAAAQIAQGLQKLSDAGYPVSTITNLDRSGQLSDEEREELARWVDMLDRF